MIANEAEHEGGAGASIGRILLLCGLVLVVVACVLPAAVIGFSAETKPPEETKPRSIPAARGDAGRVTPAAIAPESAPAEALPAEGPAATEDLRRIVFGTRNGAHYHRAGCSRVDPGAAALTLGKARERGQTPCPICGGG